MRGENFTRKEVSLTKRTLQLELERLSNQVETFNSPFGYLFPYSNRTTNENFTYKIFKD